MPEQQGSTSIGDGAVSELAADVSVEELEAQFAEAPPPKPTSSKRPSRFRKVAMRPRRALVLVHRWLALVLVVWAVIVAATGAWLVGHQAIESWFDGDRYRATPGDIGPQAATDAALEEFPEGASSYGLTLPRNGRGVYQVYGEVLPPRGRPKPRSRPTSRPSSIRARGR